MAFIQTVKFGNVFFFEMFQICSQDINSVIIVFLSSCHEEHDQESNEYQDRIKRLEILINKNYVNTHLSYNFYCQQNYNLKETYTLLLKLVIQK
jgi:hypothetical protein